MTGRKRLTDSKVVQVGGALVGVLWIGSTAWDIVSETYTPPTTLGIIFTAIVSTILGLAAKEFGIKRDDDDKPGGDDE